MGTRVCRRLKFNFISPAAAAVLVVTTTMVVFWEISTKYSYMSCVEEDSVNMGIERDSQLAEFENILMRNHSVRLDSSWEPLVSACSAGRTVSRRVSEPYRAVEVHAHGTLLQRVRAFNLELERVRIDVWLSRRVEEPGRIIGLIPVRLYPSVQRKVVNGMDDDFLLQLSHFSEVTTVVLPFVACSEQRLVTTEADESNLLVKNYYLWSATEPLCSKIGSKIPLNNLKYDNIYRTDCNTDISSSVIERPRSLPRVFLNSICTNRVRYYVTAGGGRTSEQDFYDKSPPIAFFCHVIHDAVVTDVGDVFTNNLKLVPFGCSTDLTTCLPRYALSIPLYDEVFVITQQWGNAVFHRMIEIMPRVVVYRTFLRRHPDIKILAPEKDDGRLAQLLQIIGLDPERVVTGWVRAKVVYLPRPSMCGMASVPEIQILSSLYRQYAKKHLMKGLTATTARPHTPKYPHSLKTAEHNTGTIVDQKQQQQQVWQRNRLILIRRSGSRHFTEHAAIEAALTQAAADYNLEFALFIDNPSPSLNDTMRLFHSAVMVVGPHGAGLANIVFSQPGTYVIEGVCNNPHINLCFHRLAVVLGHHWHGIISRQGCEDVVDVAASSIATAVRAYLSGRTIKTK